MNGADMIFVFGVLLAAVAVVIATAAFICVKKMEGKIEMLLAAPVLRQYVERYVPIDNSEEAQRVMQKKMADMEAEFDKSLDLMPNGVSVGNKRAETNMLRADELV